MPRTWLTAWISAALPVTPAPPTESERGIDTVKIESRGDLADVPPVTLDRADVHGLDARQAMF
ncbi:hypothetical protein [Nocardioides pelophilus]|uniref:hypothetical protein n=1 Tax=Nocardioides pelophilus TaxID=2172019 RepID=UPI0015FF6310|nr:hypothetical protein [Nocardioides pelophilus]